MSIRRLAAADQCAYAEFRRQLWPYHASAGYWEAVEAKYVRNPLARLCPESGLYGYFQGERLCGTMGAYPMPVTLDGTVHAGHSIADWSVLREFWFSPIAGRLWNEIYRLPGRKFASRGTRLAQDSMKTRGVKLNVTQSFGLIRPLPAIGAKLFRLGGHAYPSPFLPDQLQPYHGVEVIAAAQVRTAAPPLSEKTAWVRHSAEFWESYCQARMCNGAIPLRVHTAEGEADLVVNFCETGRFFRYSTLMSAQFIPYTVRCAAAVGRSLGAFLGHVNVCLLSATDADAELAKLVEQASWYVHRTPSYWWACPKASDSFSHDSVSWWLTTAARDSHFGGLQPFTEETPTSHPKHASTL